MAETKDNNPISALFQHERLRVPGMYLSFMAKHFMHDKILMSAGSLAFQTLAFSGAAGGGEPVYFAGISGFCIAQAEHR